jgi:dihydropteroate synthase
MVSDGALLIDVGGESTRPSGTVYGRGASVVDAAEERARVVPVIRRIRTELPDSIVSVDTYKAGVAAAALDAGAHVVNDVTGLRFSDQLARLAAASGAALIVMHSAGKPGQMTQEHHYKDLISEVRTSLANSAAAAHAAGVKSVVVDPGFGFGKTVSENLRLVRRLPDFTQLGLPVLIGVSRKSSIGAVLGGESSPSPVGERLFGSLGATAIAALNGVSIVRTHDVAPTVQMIRVLNGIASA